MGIFQTSVIQRYLSNLNKELVDEAFQKIKLSLMQQDELEACFDTCKTETNNIQNQINQANNGINQMIYKLYELTVEEIKIVEEAV